MVSKSMFNIIMMEFDHSSVVNNFLIILFLAISVKLILFYMQPCFAIQCQVGVLNWVVLTFFVPRFKDVCVQMQQHVHS